MNKLEIKYLVEEITEIDDIATTLRTAYMAEVRYVYYGLCKRFLNEDIFTFKSIGDSLNRDHASVIHGLRKFEYFYEDKKWFGKYLYDLCVHKIENRNYMMRLRNQQLKKKRKCNTKQFKIIV